MEEFLTRRKQEILDRFEKEQKARQEWVNKSRGSLERALNSIDKYHERKLLWLQVILLVFFGAGLVNILTSAIYDLFVTLQRLCLDVGVVTFSIVALVVVYFLLKRELSKYNPPKPFLSFRVNPEDTKDFLEDSVYEDMMEYLKQGKLMDFRAFGDSVFESMNNLVPLMFTGKVKERPIQRYEELADPGRKEVPTLAQDYDLSPFSTTRVKLTFQVKLVPDFMSFLTCIGDMSACHSFYLFFYLTVLNPEHCDAGTVIREYYDEVASRILELSSLSIDFAFRKLTAMDSKENKN